jgi:hypothetical protein
MSIWTGENKALFGESDFIYFAWPCCELIPRDDATISRTNWSDLWTQKGGRLFGGRMIARKGSPIWAAFGIVHQNSEGDYVLRDLHRKSCIALGVIDEDTDIQGSPESRKEGEEQASEFDPSFLKVLREDLDVEIAEARAAIDLRNGKEAL